MEIYSREGVWGEVSSTPNTLSEDTGSISCLDTWMEKEQTMMENMLLCELLFIYNYRNLVLGSEKFGTVLFSHSRWADLMVVLEKKISLPELPPRCGHGT